jgi:phosphoribosylformylglycinamidine cyclo-ligase
VKLAAQLRLYDTVGIDLVAMNVNDLIVQGAEPLFFLDYVGIHKIDPVIVEQIVKGIADGCQIADCSLIGGETAELPDLYDRDDFDLAGFAVGVCELKRMVDGTRAAAEDVIIGLPSSGVHSNGYSLVRAIVREEKLDLAKVYPDLDDQRPLGHVLLTPTRIYSRSIVAVLRSYRRKQPVTAMAHITGGGLPGNLPRVLGGTLDARLEPGSWPMPAVFPFLQKHGSVQDEEMYRVFNMGIGYVLVVKPWFGDSIVQQLRRLGEQPVVIGRIVKGAGRVRFD